MATLLHAGSFRGNCDLSLFLSLSLSLSLDGTWQASRFNKTRTHGTIALATVIDA